MSEFITIDKVLNMSRTIVRDHSTNAQWEVTLQVNEYLLIDGAYSESYQISKIEHFGKMIMSFNC